MRQNPILLPSAVTVAATLALSGCAPQAATNAPSTTSPMLSTSRLLTSPHPATLPAPQALTEVLYRLADPTVPSDQKLSLIEGATAEAAATLDKFSTALRDSGYLPMNFQATNIAWLDTGAAAARAVINITTHNPTSGAFAFPMEFTQHQGSWQLSKKTADWLLAFGNSQIGTSAGPPR